MNGVYIRDMQPDALVARMLPWLEEAGLASASDLDARHEWLLALAPLVSERLKRMTDIAPMVQFLFTEDMAIDPVAAESVLTKEGAGLALSAAGDTLASLGAWTSTAIEGALRTLPETLQMKPKVVFQMVRVAVTGSMVSPPLFESIALMGRERALARLRAAQSMTGVNTSREQR
jgi:glutamyl-tRNA synthetase